MFETFEKFMGIDSTATGYDIVALKKTTKPNHCIVSRRYKNISIHSMRRFYKLSNSMMSVSQKSTVHWKQHRNIFSSEGAK